MTVAPGSDANAQDIISSVYMYAADAGGSDTYAVSLPTAPSSYTDGLTIRFKANTANTGASTLNVNSLGAIAIKRPTGSDTKTNDIRANQIVEVLYRGGSFYMISPALGDVPFYQQSVPAILQAGKHARASGSSQDGSVLYIVHNNTTELWRYERDSFTGSYKQTHSVNMTTPIASNDYGSIVEIGIYIYVFYNDGTNIICKRYLAADLTGEQTMTVPTVACTSQCTAWSDGTDLYIISETSNTTARKWTLSGTTFTASSTATCSTNLTGNGQSCTSIYDGTTVYVLRLVLGTPNTFNIYKLGALDGSSITSTTSITLYPFFDEFDSGAILLNIDSTKIYYGVVTSNFNTTTEIGSNINLIPLAKP